MAGRNLSADIPSPMSETAPTASKTPQAEIEGRVTGVLRRKYEEWGKRFSSLLTGLGLNTWEEYDECEYQDMEVKAISDIVTDETTTIIDKEKKPPSELLPSKMEAMRLAKAMRSIARERAGLPTSPSSDAKSRATADSERTESQLTRDTAKLGIFSHLKSDEKLEQERGYEKPPHVFDAARYLEEQAKPLVGMEGYEPLAAMLEVRKVRPDIDVGEFTDLYRETVPEDVGRHHSRLCYEGISSQCKKEVLSQSRYKHRLFDPGIMPFALYEVSLDVSDLEASQKRCDYQKPIAVRQTDKPMLMAGFKQFERNSFELYQLRELGTARTSPQEVQYMIGSALFSNYPDISHKWSRLWGEAANKSMEAMRGMMQDIAVAIKELPDFQSVAHPARPTGMLSAQKPGNFPELQDKYVCRDFQRTGTCTYESRTGKKCRFAHAKAKVMLASLSTQDKDVKALQDTLNDLNHEQKAEAGEFIEKEHFRTLYDAVYMDTGTPKFTSTHGELVMVFHEDLADMDDSDDSSAAAAQQEVDNWRIY